MNQTIEEQYKNEINAPFEDSLTGLYNFGFFQLSLDREIHRSNRYGKSFTLSLIDIDNFAEFNRQYGSLKGDLMLKKIGRIVKETLRKPIFQKISTIPLPRTIESNPTRRSTEVYPEENRCYAE